MTVQRRTPTVRVSLDMSLEANELLESLAAANSTTKSQILRRAVTLYHVAFEAKNQGNHVGILDRDKQVITEIVGL